MAVNEEDAAVYSEKIVEGKTILYVPKSSLNAKIPPKTPAFYNPHAELSRDISLAAYRVVAGGMHRPVAFAEALAGVGARGVRVAVEVPEVDFVFINDLNPVAVKMAEASAKANGVVDRCRFSVSDSCSFLIAHSAPQSRFDIVDLDPFGTPAPHIDCALRSVKNGGVLSVTATDTAVLCGIYPKVSYRKYHGYSLRTEYCHELGLRILLGAVAHNAMKLDLGVKPLFAHSTRHYFRVFTTVKAGVAGAEETHGQIGYILHCFRCHFRETCKKPYGECPECGSPLKAAGPLWIGPIYEKGFIQRLAEDFQKYLFSPGVKMATAALQEVDMPPTYFTPNKWADEMNITTPSTKSLLEALEETGYRASRTAIHPRGLKTDAPIKVFRQILKKLSGTDA